MSLFIKFPSTLHSGYLMPIIPIRLYDHKVWVYVDPGAIFSVLSAAEATDMDIDWRAGRHQMIVVGDGSFIPVYLHNLPLHLGDWQLQAPIGFSERLHVQTLAPLAPCDIRSHAYALPQTSHSVLLPCLAFSHCPQ